MKYGAAYLASAILAVTAIASVSGAAQSQTAQSDWTTRVTVSSKGGHILGNPLAKNTLVEYVSYTCNHCANFEVESHNILKSSFVAKGHLSTEVRNYVRDPVDLTAALLARCGGRTKFFGNHNALMSAQNVWLATVQATSPEVQKTWFEGDFTTRLKKIANDVKFYSLMKKRGFTKAQLDTCLADETAREQIVGMTNFASKTLKIEGTPSFTINGELQKKVHAWGSLRTRLNSLQP